MKLPSLKNHVFLWLTVSIFISLIAGINDPNSLSGFLVFMGIAYIIFVPLAWGVHAGVNLLLFLVKNN